MASPLLSRLACGSIVAFTFARLFLSLLIVSRKHFCTRLSCVTGTRKNGLLELCSLKNKRSVINEMDFVYD